MNSHTPQEWADWTGCCVAQDEDEGFWMFPDKPKIDLISKCWGETDDFCICIPEELVEIPDDHKWTHLYEPRKADNAPHQSEVFIHKEYRIVKAHKEINPEAFAQGVAVWLNSGWKPCGGIAFDKEGCPYQAMVRGV